jgi:hypothetical protein
MTPPKQSTATPKPEADGELSEAALDKISGGTDPAPATTSNVMKTKHDTVKNAISNVR